MQFDLSSQSYFSRLLTIRSFPGLGSISAGVLALIAERSEEVRLPVGYRLYKEGEPVKTLYFICEGEVQVHRQGRLQAKVGAKEVCGSMSVFAGEQQGPEAIVSSPVLALRIDASDANEIFQDNFDLMMVGLRNSAGFAVRYRAELSAPLFEGKDHQEFSPASLLSRLSLLARAFPFAEDRLEALAELVTVCRYPQVTKNEVIALENGEAMILPSPLSLVGFHEAIAELPSPQITAPGSTPAIVFSGYDFLDWLEDHSDLSLRLLKQFATEIISMQQTISKR